MKKLIILIIFLFLASCRVQKSHINDRPRFDRENKY